MDRYGRRINYLRLAITDRCNLRCTYCMPHQGVQFVPYPETMRYEEMTRMVRIFSRLGVTKVRITGGEPFIKKDLLPFLHKIHNLPGVENIHITTNGVATARHLDALKEIGISGLNLSLDTLDRQRFWKITRYDHLDKVMATFFGALKRKIPLKINTVVLDETSDKEILAMVELARKYPVPVRFIEKMPFSGGSGVKNSDKGKLKQRLNNLLSLTEFPSTEPTTARLFSLSGDQGVIGVIEGHSRQFCTTCNKVRITPLGILKTCLYDNGVLDLKALLRSGASDEKIEHFIMTCIGNRHQNGHKAEQQCTSVHEPSMASIGG